MSKEKDSRRSLGRTRAEVSFPAAPTKVGLPKNYPALLADLKERIQRERIRTILSVNAGMVLLYWDIGRSILQNQKIEGWGAKVVDRISTNLRQAFPNMRGFSLNPILKF